MPSKIRWSIYFITNWKMTLIKIIYHRFCEFVKVCDKMDLLILWHKMLLIALLLSMTWVYSVEMIMWSINNRWIMWLLFWMIIFFDDIVLKIHRILLSIKFDIPKMPKKTKQPLVSQLRDFLLKYDWFPVKQAMDVFWLTTRQVKAVGDALESEWILTRGDANARILNKAKIHSPDWSYTIMMADQTKLAYILDKTIAKP